MKTSFAVALLFVCAFAVPSSGKREPKAKANLVSLTDPELWRPDTLVVDVRGGSSLIERRLRWGAMQGLNATNSKTRARAKRAGVDPNTLPEAVVTVEEISRVDEVSLGVRVIQLRATMKGGGRTIWEATVTLQDDDFATFHRAFACTAGKAFGRDLAVKAAPGCRVDVKQNWSEP